MEHHHNYEYYYVDDISCNDTTAIQGGMTLHHVAVTDYVFCMQSGKVTAIMCLSVASSSLGPC